jgi:hypothetical protein
VNLREREAKSIRDFVQSAADEGYLSGRVLDYGCGKQPYRDIVEAAGGEYHGTDSPDYPGSVVSEFVHPGWPHIYDAVLCTQVLQYIPVPHHALRQMRNNLVELNVPKDKARHLVLTYPTNWPEVEPEDLHRFTKAGMERLLTEAGFEIIKHVQRASFKLPDSTDYFALGYGVICRA